ncbi:MAG: NADH:ubiquinone reductase (Na(+)-transporting) subunit E [Saprospiraceae bacterium]|jgi:Na+-transporting NADH:ubiquinone oxidoreductase subunit E|nr:NADH:ubiquinone reductase (Na(+)-transporting) subunit E [Saprospiraceae bacterium]MBK6480787.1 NADH:ubiquinone reductase (Na(+)-transporting) subunit E [Saprospiraceae bacterium]MBK6816855.1 NADH:ubiquinone reductase (Na(+)-transporting) subunit E [Saprospiraceae bacterium]MBK7371383.1 NADH:ubiquinone reductase (Na(+)-transporting) subunit E [Saprospiraceae bacterium]MBK7436122.1 NADH:ubiquinone reductase (Na(+)-transporting) subunit E [Saprospiraceae bacterium]
MDLLNIFIKSAFIENMVLSYFIGMCSFLAVSKSVKTAIGLGAAVIFVLAITVPINWVISEKILGPNGLFKMDLTFLRFILFIASIAATVQLVEMAVEKYSPSLYNALGIFLPLITVNCAILGAALFMVAREYNFQESVVYGVGSGIGWFIAIVLMAAIREKLRYSHVPAPLRGLGIAFIITAFLGVAFMSLMGINPSNYFTK